MRQDGPRNRVAIAAKFGIARDARLRDLSATGAAIGHNPTGAAGELGLVLPEDGMSFDVAWSVFRISWSPDLWLRFCELSGEALPRILIDFAVPQLA